MEVLEKLGIYGLSKIEDIILAGLVTGDPVLLIGRHGSAKTLLAKRIAETLSLKFIAYDASKALFEDVIGFPDPNSLKDGCVNYISTPISIWDKEFILIDEISRATPSMQNKWLEVIRSRQIMGQKIPSLKYIFAAMNPALSYIGSIPLDPALAGRFAFIVCMPEIQQMNETDIEKIINNISDDDAFALKDANIINLPPVGDNIKEIISSAQKLFVEIRKKYEPLLLNYIKKIFYNLLIHNLPLDGRRLGMLERNLISYLSVKTVKYGDTHVNENLFEYFYDCLANSLPYEATGEILKEEVLKSVHLSAIKNIYSNLNFEHKIKISQSKNYREKVKIYISNFDKITEFEHNEIVKTFTEKVNNINEPDEIIDVYLAIKELVKFYQTTNGNIPVDVKRRIFELYQNITSMTSETKNLDDLLDICVNKKENMSNVEITLDNEILDIALRLTLFILPSKFKRRFYSPNVTNEFFESLKEKLNTILKKE